MAGPETLGEACALLVRAVGFSLLLGTILGVLGALPDAAVPPAMAALAVLAALGCAAGIRALGEGEGDGR